MGALLLKGVELEGVAGAALNGNDDAKRFEIFESGRRPKLILGGERNGRLALHPLTMGTTLRRPYPVIAPPPPGEVAVFGTTDDQQMDEPVVRLRH